MPIVAPLYPLAVYDCDVLLFCLLVVLNLFVNSYSVFDDSGLYSILQIAIEVAQLYIFINAIKPSTTVPVHKNSTTPTHA